MNDQEFKLSNLELSQWINAIRDISDPNEWTRALDALWYGQLASKGWLVNNLKQLVTPNSSPSIYIFGGWIGILANMILQCPEINARKIRSIDLDPWCEPIADKVNKWHEMNDWRFKAVTADMSTYEYQSDIWPDIVINTSSEHVTQEVYQQWYDNIPTGTLVIVQGNDYFSCDEHIRCSKDLDEFKRQNLVKEDYYSGEIETNVYRRFMSIWRK